MTHPRAGMRAIWVGAASQLLHDVHVPRGRSCESLYVLAERVCNGCKVTHQSRKEIKGNSKDGLLCSEESDGIYEGIVICNEGMENRDSGSIKGGLKEGPM